VAEPGHERRGDQYDMKCKEMGAGQQVSISLEVKKW